MYGVQERKKAPYRNRQRSVSTSLTGGIDCGHFLQWPILSPPLNKITCTAARIYTVTQEKHQAEVVFLIWDFSEITKQHANNSVSAADLKPLTYSCNPGL